jgi:hypothetical protein
MWIVAQLRLMTLNQVHINRLDGAGEDTSPIYSIAVELGS